MADELGRTVVPSSCTTSTWPPAPDRIVAMREGRLVADGPTSELMTPELLREVFDVEVEVHELAGRRIGVPWSEPHPAGPGTGSPGTAGARPVAYPAATPVRTASVRAEAGTGSNAPRSWEHTVPAGGVAPVNRYCVVTEAAHELVPSEVCPTPSTVTRVLLGSSSATTAALR
jgi:hypothetical protein